MVFLAFSSGWAGFNGPLQSKYSLCHNGMLAEIPARNPLFTMLSVIIANTALLSIRYSTILSITSGGHPENTCFRLRTFPLACGLLGTTGAPGTYDIALADPVAAEPDSELGLAVCAPVFIALL